MEIRITLKGVISIIVIISSIIICIFGLNYQKKQNNKDKIVNAESTFKDEMGKMETMQQQVNGYYLDDTYEFIKVEIDPNQLEDLLNSVTMIKTTPEDFELEKTEFSENLLETSGKLTSIKTDIINKLNDLTLKQESQTKITALFLHSPKNWQVNEGDNVINANLTMEQIEQIRSLIYKKTKKWREAMDSFLADAQTQLTQYATLKKSIEDQMDGEKLTPSVTLEIYSTLAEQAHTIKNEQLRTGLLAKLEVIHSLLSAQIPQETIVDEQPSQVEEIIIE